MSCWVCDKANGTCEHKDGHVLTPELALEMEREETATLRSRLAAAEAELATLRSVSQSEFLYLRRSLEGLEARRVQWKAAARRFARRAFNWRANFRSVGAVNREYWDRVVTAEGELRDARRSLEEARAVIVGYVEWRTKGSHRGALDEMLAIDRAARAFLASLPAGPADKEKT